MTTVFSRHIPVAGTYNVRDLGGYDTPNGRTAWRRLLRADGLHRLDQAGMDLLVETGVRTIIDLRHASELASQPNPFATNSSVRYHNISLIAELSPQLSNASVPLPQLYCRLIDRQQSMIAQVFELIAEAGEGTVLFHCTAGKDRTGLIAALLLGLVGVSEDHILTDYAQTAAFIAPMVDEVLQRITASDADFEKYRAFLASDRAFMEAALRHIEDAHGSIVAYLAAIGLDQRVLERVSMRLLAA